MLLQCAAIGGLALALAAHLALSLLQRASSAAPSQPPSPLQPE